MAVEIAFARSRVTTLVTLKGFELGVCWLLLLLWLWLLVLLLLVAINDSCGLARDYCLIEPLAAASLVDGGVVLQGGGVSSWGIGQGSLAENGRDAALRGGCGGNHSC